jgi:penicillin amidase
VGSIPITRSNSRPLRRAVEPSRQPVTGPDSAGAAPLNPYRPHEPRMSKVAPASDFPGPLSLVLLLALLGLGAAGIGPLPALGPLLDPVHGVWSSARQASPDAGRAAVVPTLDGPVEVVFDERGVPHVYATTTLDAVRALGYLQATDRLFQLELQWRAPAGRLTELVGARALGLDQAQRRLGMRRAAQRAWGKLPPDDPNRALYEALADGINARIDTLGRTGIPFEYHFLGQRPTRWSPVNSLLIEKRMAYTLSYGTSDLWRLRAEGLVGKAAADALYPVNNPIQQPIQPNGSPLPDRLPHRLPPPEPRNAGLVRQAEAMLAAVPPPPALPPGIVLGSNNWAVASARTEDGGALLAGDPHLSLTLPSIWYEVHLVVPGELDVHGASIPGLPGVIIGFTPEVAWSVTNNYADIVDFYRETLDDDAAPTRYRLDGQWVPLERVAEEYRGPRGELLLAETHHYTHRGPLRRTDAAGALSMRWLALERSPGPAPFFAAARAGTIEELMEAFAGYAVPAQNFVMADVTGRIAIRSTGAYPIRPPVDDDGGGAADGAVASDPRLREGDGRLLRDGSLSANDWDGFWPLSRYPQALAPAQGYLASANQQPVDPRAEPGYLGANWTSPWRALRINELLREHDRVSVDDMRRFQVDPGNAKAARFVPVLLEAAAPDASVVAGAAEQAAIDQATALLSEWDYRYTADAQAPLLFERTLERLAALTWDELEDAGDSDLPAPPRPREAVLYALTDDPQSPWWDDLSTPEREDRDALVRRALVDAWTDLVDEVGGPGEGAWAWGEHRRANIYHLARLPGLGRLSLPLAGGGPGNLNPSSGDGNHGASWRMVVDLHPARGVRAYTTYPGGQSGNPASARYDDRLPGWQAGELAPAISPATLTEARTLPYTRQLSLRPGMAP